MDGRNIGAADGREAETVDVGIYEGSRGTKETRR